MAFGSASFGSEHFKQNLCLCLANCPLLCQRNSVPPSSDFGETCRRDKQRIRVNSRKSRFPSPQTRATFWQGNTPMAWQDFPVHFGDADAHEATPTQI